WGPMTFVLVGCRKDNHRRARTLEAKLGARRVDACNGLERTPLDVRAGAYQAAIDKCALMVVLWSDNDNADAAFVDCMLYARRGGKLLVALVGEARLPAILGGDDAVLDVFDENNARALEALADLIAERVLAASSLQGSRQTSTCAARDETKAFL